MPVVLTRTDTMEVVPLPPNLYWSNYGLSSGVTTDAQRSLQGTMIYQDFVPIGGVSVELTAPEDMNWISRDVLEVLRSWARIPALVMTATITGGITASLDVRFDHTRQPCIEATPVRGYDFSDPKDDFHVSLYLITL